MKKPERQLTSDELIQAARDLVPMLREHADEVDSTRRLPENVFQAMQDSGLLHAHKPRKYGGFEMTPYEHAMICVELARGCTSASWVFSLLNSHSVMVLGYPEQAQEEIWADDSYVLTAGSVFPDPKRSSARAVEGGYLLSGQFPFTSGSDFADWIKLAAFVDGGPRSCLFLVPKSELTVLDDWFTLGMRGTGSRSMVAQDVFVPEYRAIERTPTGYKKNPELLALHPTFDMLQSETIFAGCFLVSAPIIGAALNALDFFATNAGQLSRYSRASSSQNSIARSDAVQLAFSEAAAEIEMASSIIAMESREIGAYNALHKPVPREVLMRQNRDSAYICRAAKRSVDKLFSAIGSKATFEGHLLNRVRRDIDTAITQQANNWQNVGTAYARFALNLTEVSDETAVPSA